MTRKRSKYRPKAVIQDTVAHVLGGFRLVQHVDGAATTLKIKNHQALASMVQGTGSRDDIDILIAAMNLGMEIHDAQLDACTVGQLEKALDFVAREIRARRARAIA